MPPTKIAVRGIALPNQPNPSLVGNVPFTRKLCRPISDLRAAALLFPLSVPQVRLAVAHKS